MTYCSSIIDASIGPKLEKGDIKFPHSATARHSALLRRKYAEVLKYQIALVRLKYPQNGLNHLI